MSRLQMELSQVQLSQVKLQLSQLQLELSHLKLKCNLCPPLMQQAIQQVALQEMQP